MYHMEGSVQLPMVIPGNWLDRIVILGSGSAPFDVDEHEEGGCMVTHGKNGALK